MRELSQAHWRVLTAAFLHVPPRRQRALLHGQDGALAEWAEQDTSRKVTHARHRAREAAERLRKLGAHLVLCTDPEYPPGLHDLHDPPAFLAVLGSLQPGGIAIVGTRDASDIAQKLAFDVAKSCGRTVVSGLARGIDSAAHRGALEAKLPTIAYVGTGLGVTYPPANKPLEEAILAAGGAIVSERLPDEPVAAWSLVHRDRLQAAHARAVVLIASEADGGAMHTMRFANELHRPAFAVAGGEFAFSGNAAAIAQGAHAVAPAASEIVKALARSI